MNSTVVDEPEAGSIAGPFQPERRPKVAYIMSRFPKISETFVFREINAVKERGVDVEVFPLLREKTSVMHPEVAPLVEKARFTPFLSKPILKANLAYFRQQPLKYVGTFLRTLHATLGSRRFFGGAVAYFPKSVYFASEMSRLDVDHIHAHFASFPAAVAFVVNRLTGIPFSFTAHGSDLHRDQTMLREKVQASAFTVSISQYNRRIVIEKCGQDVVEKLPIVRCGIDADFFQFRTQPTPFDQVEGPLQLACTGTLHEVKGQVHLLRACHLLSKRGIDYRCHLIGDGPDREMLENTSAELKIENNVIFHGACTAEEVRDCVQQADIYLCPSVPSRDGRREGIPVALMEAMACGVPCVASRLSGIPELIEHDRSGLLCEPGEDESIATAIERLASNSHFRREIALAAREQIQSEFDLDNNVDQLVAHFEEVVHANA